MAQDYAAFSTVIVREGGRSSIPESSAMESKSLGVLDTRLRGYDGGGWGALLPVIARSEATKQSSFLAVARWIALPALAMTVSRRRHGVRDAPLEAGHRGGALQRVAALSSKSLMRRC
jgi:hypothetical protein